MEGRLIDVPHLGVVAMMAVDDRTDHRHYKPEDLQSLLQDFSRDLELSIWPPLGNSVLVQKSIEPRAIDEHMFGADLVPEAGSVVILLQHQSFHQENLLRETAHNLHVDTVSDDAVPHDQHLSYSCANPPPATTRPSATARIF